MDIGIRIRARREKLNLKQIDLARALTISPQAVSKWERGETCPDIAILVELAKILDVSTDFLLGANDLGQGIFEATVFSTSLSQYAQKSIAMKSPEIAEYANIIFHHLTDAVLKYDAVPVKYLGDGFLCFFSGANHAQRAYEAAIYAKRIIQDDKLKIALNSGPIYLGTIGHPDYCSKDICGETVNLAFLMLEHISKICKSGIGLSSTTSSAIMDAQELMQHRDNYIEIIDSTITIYEPKDINI